MTLDDLTLAIALGVVEGLTEFLPVSSTGHLILAGELLGFNDESSIAFKIAIQLGAILAVVVVYWRRFLQAGLGVLSGQRAELCFVRNILMGVVPALLVGAVAYSWVRLALQTPMIVAVALVLGGVAILLIERSVQTARVHGIEDLSLIRAGAIGLVQCLAMIPGVSRSGATIMGALLMGVDRKTAAEFSFFLAAPTMLAATVYALLREGPNLSAGDLQLIAVGFVTAFVVAVAVVKAFVAIVGRYGFAPFAWYRIIVGSAALLWLSV